MPSPAQVQSTLLNLRESEWLDRDNLKKSQGYVRLQYSYQRRNRISLCLAEK
ncbi:hypothetical protein D3C78_789500 [compost metagenome]